jgi:hypothetical protein
MIECNNEQPVFHALGKRTVAGIIDAGTIRADSGRQLLSEGEARTGIIARMAEQFTDHCDPEDVAHSVRDLVTPMRAWPDTVLAGPQ